MWSVDTLGDPYLWHPKLGQCDLLYRFYRSKFIFLMLVLVQRLLAVGPNWLAGRTLSPRPFLTYHPFDLEPFLKVTVDVWNLTWSRFKCGTNGSQGSNLSYISVSVWFMMDILYEFQFLLSFCAVSTELSIAIAKWRLSIKVFFRGQTNLYEKGYKVHIYVGT